VDVLAVRDAIHAGLVELGEGGVRAPHLITICRNTSAKGVDFGEPNLHLPHRWC
jgi:hypothetical protein